MTLLAGKKKPLVLRDEIHGDMSFDPLVRCVVDHEGFQRLRYIKQLGLGEYVFPCATHTRFQHSLGRDREIVILRKRRLEQFGQRRIVKQIERSKVRD